MHELSVTENILEIATTHAIRNEAKKVSDINIIIGQLSSIVDDSVQFYWDIISKDTICDLSQLHFERKEAVFLCSDCKTEFAPGHEIIPCPNCGSINLQLLSGEEFYLESIEIIK